MESETNPIGVKCHQADARQHPLSLLWLELTTLCNLQCVHCYAESSPSGSHGSMTPDDWIRVIDEAVSLGSPTLQFIGGEPTVHPSLARLIRRAHEQGLKTEVYSNLVRITPELWTAFEECNVALATSFYSTSAEAHDRITTTQGSQRLTLAGIQEALKRSLRLRVGIVAIHRGQDVAATELFLRSLGVQHVRTDGIRAVGRGSVLTRCEKPSDALCGRCGSGSGGSGFF